MHHSFKRALAVLLSILLAAGNLGLTAFAEGPAAAASPSDVVTGFVQIDEDEYAIINDTGWQIFADSVNGGNSYSGCTVYLRTDINVSQKVGVVEGRYLSDPFSGVFDGNNHTIHVAITDTDNQGTAPFCYINGATIKNLNVQGSVTGTYHTAAIVGFSTGSGNRIENCTASATVDGGGGNVGGILGHAKDSSITIAGTIFSGLMTGSGPKGAILGWGDVGGDKYLHECLYLMAEGQDTANLDLAKMDEGSVTVSSCLKTCDAGSYGSRAYFSAPSDRICKSVRFHGVALYAAAETNVPSFIRYPGEPFPLEPVVTWLDTPLTPGTDYSLTIEGVEGNIINHSGVYTLHFTGLGAYHGTQTAVVTILGSVPYLDADGETAYRTDYTFLTGSETEWSGWYVAAGTVDIGSRVTVSGEAHLILADGAALTIPKGVTVIETDSLTIYAQSTGDGMGALTIDGVGTYYAGIGGDSNCRPCGVITINGGFVEAAGGLYGAGIGGGSGVAGGKITVNGGEVTATGGQYSAGIGGGSYAAGGKTTIRGGTVTATGGQYGAGIGGGYEAAGGEITISGGRVTAKAGNLWLAGGIGPGFGFGYSNPGTLTMSLSRPDEFIQADSYSCYLKTYDRQKYLSVRVANGCYLKDSSGNLYSGELSHDTLDALEGVKLLYAAVFHTVSVAATQHGTVTASHTTAEHGTQITLTVSPEAGCVLTSLTVNGIDVTAEVSNGSYSFPMPDADVEVSAVFAVALEQEGDTYTIYRSEGWDMFCDLLANNPKGYYTQALGEVQGKQAYAVSAGEDVTLGLAGALSVYELSGLTVSDAHVGLQYGDVIYAAAGEELSIRLSCVFPGHGGYFVNAGTLSGTENPYTLAMPAQDVRVDALTDLPFVDVEREKYYFNAVLWAFYHEPPITTGVSEISFGPSLNCTRAQVVTFLWKAAGAPAPLSTESPFLDVQPDAYYCQAVLWALEQGITAGTDAEHFSPDNVCTRAEAVTFLYAWQGRPAVDSQADMGFADVSPDDYYHDAVAWAVSHGVTAGTDATHFSPSANCTRAHMLTFLFRAAGNAT